MRNLDRKRPGRRSAPQGRGGKGYAAPMPDKAAPAPQAEPTQPPVGQAGPLEHGRLADLVRAVARLYRRVHLTAEEARYVHRQVRFRLGLRGRPERVERLPEVLSPDELARVLAHAYQERGLYGLIVRTLFETGLRVSELVKVEIQDLDFLERTIRVRRGKGGKDRVVLFTENLGQQLRLHLRGRTRGSLFESNRATAFSVRRIQQIVRQVARQAGVEKSIHPHTYRHSMATYLRNQGVPLDVVQLLLGHADPRTTQLYARLSMGTARGEYDRAMAALGQQKAVLP